MIEEFKNYFFSKNYSEIAPVKISSGVDKSVRFIGSHISPMKPYFLNNNIPDSGLIMSQPIAYQKILHSDGSYYYALLYYCEVDVDGDFEKDIAGTITRIAWIKPEDHSKYLEEKPFRRAVIKSALEFIESRNK